MNRHRLTGFLAALAIFVADQATKFYVTIGLGIDSEGEALELLPIFDLRFLKNTGVSLGLFAAESDAARWLLVLLTAAIAAGVAVWMTREKNRYDLLALGLVLGGAVGNILDRMRFGYVVDFADLHFGEWRPFLVFNIADAAITIGVVILLARALFVREKPDQGDVPVENSNA